MPVERRYGGSAVTSRPPMRIAPAEGRMKPAIMRSVVVLPQPEGPSNARSSPCATASEKSRTASVAP